MAYNNASDFLIAGNDEHGVMPPTLGKRTPIMPYINRAIYENEFNFAAKNYFLADCLRIGFYILDVKPNRQDLSVSSRVVIVNNSNANLVLTFAYNASGDGTTFDNANGTEAFYSPLNNFASESQVLANAVYDSVIEATGRRGRGVKTLDVAMLSAVKTRAALLEAGFMTNFEEAKLMIDPDYTATVGRASCKGVCNFLNVRYIPISEDTFTTIRQGSSGRLVRYLQFMLKMNGYSVGNVDGIFGRNTQNAVISFQQANNLNPDGIVGPLTWTALNNLYPENQTLRRGSIGTRVLYLQRKLYSKLYTPGVIDGIFGINTENAVKEFQRENGLNPDGIVGPLTWRAVRDNSTSRPFPVTANTLEKRFFNFSDITNN